MDKMLVLIGKAASGKDSVREILVKKHGFHSIVTYTTRPMREGEIQDITYHYISENDFLQKIESGFLPNGRNMMLMEKHGIMVRLKKI